MSLRSRSDTGAYTNEYWPSVINISFYLFDLSTNDGILYGINLHNNSLILFDRFSLENDKQCHFCQVRFR